MIAPQDKQQESLAHQSTPLDTFRMTPLLTIVVPTYNRCAQLALLLSTLQVELAPLQLRVRAVVCDNASTDGTGDFLRTFGASWPQLLVRSNPVNVGAERNFCIGIEAMESRYFWIIGDDDLPKTGVIAKLVDLLLSETPDLVYVRSHWLNAITSADQGGPIGPLNWRLLDERAFASEVNVWLTFISGMIVNRQCMWRGLRDGTLDSQHGTQLVQLGWVLPTLATGDKFVIVDDRCVLATSDNTGGYGLLTVFGINFPKIIKSAFSDNADLVHLILRPLLTGYLPALVLQSRSRRGASFEQEQPWSGMRAELGDYPGFWTFVIPAGKLPIPLARAALFVWRLVHKSLSVVARSARRRFPTDQTVRSS